MLYIQTTIALPRKMGIISRREALCKECRVIQVNMQRLSIHTLKKKSRLEFKSLNPAFKLKKLLQIWVIYTFTMDASINLHKQFAVLECLIKCVNVLL